MQSLILPCFFLLWLWNWLKHFNPSPVCLQEIVELPDYNKITFKENPAIPLEEIIPDTPPQAVDLLYKFLVYPSKQRCSARQVRNLKQSLSLKTEFLRARSEVLSFLHKESFLGT